MRALNHVLVTGGAGFLGFHLCDRLLADGARVVCVDDLSTSSPTNAAELHGRSGIEFIEHDITRALGEPLSGARFDTVFHLASPASPPDYLRLPVETLRAGADGTAVALDIAQRSRARFVLASTSEVYGDPLAHPQHESYWGNVNPIGPRSVYDEAKRFAEAATAAYRRDRGVDTAIARIFNTYGPRMRLDDGRAVPAFAKQAFTNQPLTVAGDGSQTRSLCYVEDTVAGLLALAASTHAGPVNIGNDVETTMLELAHMIRDLVGSDSAISFVDLPEDDPRVRRPDTTLAREVLGWSPQVPMVDGLTQTLAWFETQVAREPVGQPVA
jgi:dTDP-glucose 4,6-dehydratase